MLELLADKVEELCGFKPDLDTCSKFFDDGDITAPPQIETINAGKGKPVKPRKRVDVSPRKHKTSAFKFQYKKKQYTASSAREVMIKVFHLLADQDSSFYERFAARRHGRKRRYLAKDK